jgi:hypothetical protein
MEVIRFTVESKEVEVWRIQVPSWRLKWRMRSTSSLWTGGGEALELLESLDSGDEGGLEWSA